MNLILGTAEFNPEGYAGQPPIERSEIRKILACAKEGGINILDTAESYNCHSILKEDAKGFCIYTKTRDWRVHLDWGENELRGILYHYKPGEPLIELPYVHRWVNLGVSVYDRAQLPENKLRIIEVPFNIQNNDFGDVFDTYRTVFVRSIFGRGELLQNGYNVYDCINYVRSYRPDGMIVGVKNTKELEMILKAY